MLQNFLLSFSVVFPIFLLMALGFFIKRIRLVNETTVKQMNAVVFRVLLPTMLFKNVYESSVSEVFDGRLILFALGCALGAVLVLCAVVPLFVKDNAKRGALIQGTFRSNFVIFGLPIAEALCGSAATGTAAVLIAFVIPLFNVAAVVVLEAFGGKRVGAGKILKGIVKNPLIIASVLGLLVNVSGIRFPSVVETAVKNVSGITTPLALVLLGASIRFSTVRGNLRQLIAGLSVKLLVIPAVCLSLAAFAFGFRGADFAILIALFASPAAVSSFTMAVEMGGDEDLAGQLVMFGTAFSVLTMFLWIFLTIQLGVV